jgi:glucose-6-phosphate-specific signal transduction histidine kinase
MKPQIHNKLSGIFGALLFVFMLGWIDWQTGYELNFFLFYFIPVIITAWFFGIESSIFISIISSLVWSIADKFSGHNYSSNLYFVWNTLIRLVSFILIGWSFNRVSLLFHSEKNKTEDLQKALSEI